MLRDKELAQVLGGNPLSNSFKNHKKNYIIGVCVGVIAIVITIGIITLLYYKNKHKNDRWYDENPKEKLFVIEVIDNHRPINIEMIKEEYGIDEQRANFLLAKHQRR